MTPPRTPLELAAAVLRYQLAFSRAFLPPAPPERDRNRTRHTDHNCSDSRSSRADQPHPRSPWRDVTQDFDNRRQRDDQLDHDNQIDRAELDAARYQGEGPELPPALTLVDDAGALTLTDESVDEILAAGDGELPDEPQGRMLRCETPVRLIEVR